MELGGNSNTAIIDQRQDNTDDSLAMVDANALAFAVAFNAVAFPPDMPESTRAAILDRAEQIRSNSGDFIRDNQIGPRSERERQKRDEADNTDNLSLLAQIAQQQQADAWARDKHSFAGATMTGEEWGELASDIRRDGPLRDWLIQRLMREGQTKTQAERKASEFADVAEIMAKPESERTPAERERMDRADKDPLFKKVMPELQAQERALTAGQGVRESLSTDQKTSTGARSDLFASAPDLTVEHRAAVAAVEPLTPVKRDAPAPAIPTAPAPAAAGLEI